MYANPSRCASANEITPAGTVVTSQGRTIAVRFETLSDDDRSALERYIYKRISA